MRPNNMLEYEETLRVGINSFKEMSTPKKHDSLLPHFLMHAVNIVEISALSLLSLFQAALWLGSPILL